MSHKNNNDDHDVPNLGQGEDRDDGAKFSEATVIRPRSVLDDAFDAHTVVRTEKSRKLEASPVVPPAPPVMTQAPTPAPPPPSRAMTPPPSSTLPPPSDEMRDSVTNPSISKRFRREASVTNFPNPQTPPPSAGPTAAQLAEAQAVAQAQEHARQKAEQAAKQAAAQKAEQKAALEAEQKAAQEAEKAAARRAQQLAAQKAEQDAAAEAARRARQSAQVQGEQTGSFRFEETQPEFRMEPRRRKVNVKLLAGCVAVAAIGWYVVTNNAPRSDKPGTEKEIASVAADRESRKETAPSLKAPPAEAAPTVSSTGSTSGLTPAATVLSSFDDAFSRTQVRSRPDSQD